jgi:hypothetical protein
MTMDAPLFPTGVVNAAIKVDGVTGAAKVGSRPLNCSCAKQGTGIYIVTLDQGGIDPLDRCTTIGIQTKVGNGTTYEIVDSTDTQIVIGTFDDTGAAADASFDLCVVLTSVTP